MASAIKLDRPLVIFDLETTGVDVNNDRIVSICMHVHGHDAGVAWLINPGRPIPAEASAIHGIYDTHVAESLRFAERALTIKHMLEGSDVAGFNCRSFDVPMLSAEFKRTGHVWPTPDVKIVDVFKIYNHKEPRTLSAAHRHYLGCELEGAHNASVDVIACAAVLEEQAKRYGVSTLDELAALERDPSWLDQDGKVAWKGEVACINFGKWAGVPLKQVEPGYFQWLASRRVSAEGAMNSWRRKNLGKHAEAGFRQQSLDERFWSKVDKSGGHDACWPWMAAKTRGGYGTFMVTKTPHVITTAPRVAYALAHGVQIPPTDTYVCHRCDNPPCVNPAHLFLGTNKENQADAAAKGRRADGSRHPMSKLSEEQVAEMRVLRAAGTKLRLLSQRYGVAESAISRICNFVRRAS